MNSEDDKLETLVIYSKGELELNNGIEIESNFISANSLSALNRLARYKPIIKIKGSYIK